MRNTILIVIIILLGNVVSGQNESSTERLDLNKPERLEWFSNLGFGMFIHFSFDSQLGVVISHSMAGASADYLDRYVNELPKTFNPDEFDPESIATLAKLAGMKYVVFTTKHHSGFCMWDTETTEFNITNTPYKKDILTEYVDAVRDAGLAVGLYFSPEDFNFLYEKDLPVRRLFVDPIPDEIMTEYLELVELQCMELMAHYGDIDVIFFDGGEGPLQEKCKEVVWELQPDIVVTRGAIQTPEQTLPGISSAQAWESCITMGTQWAYKPTNESYKSASRLIEILIETRAKGGNLLLNIGPKPSGLIPAEQENALMEMAAWDFINGESLKKIRPWIITNENNIWYTWNPADSVLYAMITRIPDWTRGERREFTLQSVQASSQTKVEVLGHAGELIEYQPAKDAAVYFEQDEEGLHISCVRAQRIYNDHKWPNPIVLKLSNVRPALEPPHVLTVGAVKDASGKVNFQGSVPHAGDESLLKVGFQFREFAGFVEELYNDTWKETETIKISDGDFGLKTELEKGKTYQYRAFVDHPKMRIYGDIRRIQF